jgi:cysteinyl-tRNA synthetase
LRRLAKPLYGLHRIQGSNPCLSAIPGHWTQVPGGDPPGREGAILTWSGARVAAALQLSLGALLVTSQAPERGAPMALQDVRSWMYQFQGLESKNAVEALAGSPYDLLVVEPMGTYRAAKDFDMKGMVSHLHAGKRGRLVLAYLDMGQADSNRAYWQKSWKPPARGEKGDPDFLLKPDPDGWKETYVVRPSDPRWQDLVLADVARVMSAGFDGLYLDWVEAYEDKTAAAEMKAQGLVPARAVVDFISRVRQEARKVEPSARTVVQNAPYLIDEDERLVGLVDAVAFENTWFRGKAESDWGDPEGGDRPNAPAEARDSTEARLKQYARYKAAGKPVLTVDYCLRADHAGKVYEESRARGLVPLVSRVALDRMTETPPPGLYKAEKK